MNRAVESASRPEREAGERGKALANIIFNVCLGALFLALFVQAGDLPSSMWEPLGSGSFPRLVLGTLVIFNVALVIQSANTWRHTPSTSNDVGLLGWLHQRRLALATLAAFALYAVTMPWLGFALASFCFLLAVQVILGARRGRRLLVALIIAGVFSIGLDLLFRHVFLISLPQGRLW